MKLILALMLAFAPMSFASPINKSGFQGRLTSVDVTIGASGTKTAAVDLGGFTLVGILLPATFTGTALTFEAAEALAGTYRVVKAVGGSSVSLTVAQNTYVAVDPTALQGVNFIKLVSGSTEGSARTITLILKGL